MLRCAVFFLFLICALGWHPTISVAQDFRFDHQIPLEAKPVSLQPFLPSARLIGGLEFLRGFSLSSTDSDFGGLSGIAYRAQHNDMLLVTDRGRLVRLPKALDGAHMLRSPTTADIRLLPLETDLNIRRLANKDAEALALTPDGQLAVAFERNDRVRFYRAPQFESRTLPQPVALRTSRWNGIEAMTELPDGRLLALSEGIQRGGGLRAWLYDAEQGWSLLVYRTDQDFAPTGATLSPDGQQVFIVERKLVSYLQGFSARVMSLNVADLSPNAVLHPRLVARFAPGSRAQANLEGITAFPLPDGSVSLVLVSDNNFITYFQPNLLLQFRYRPDRLPPDPHMPPRPVPKPF